MTPTSPPTAAPETGGNPLADALNRDCHCISLDREQLLSSFDTPLAPEHSNLFAPYPVFVARSHIDAIQTLIAAIGAATASPEYQQRVLSRAPQIANLEPGTLGIFYGYDFHLTASGPQLIEINTNAGGALLHRELARAQMACCEPVADLFEIGGQINDPADRFAELFETEWNHFLSSVESSRALRHVAIVDLAPEQQFLYPEFLLFKEMLVERGLEVTIAGPEALRMRSGRLYVDTPNDGTPKAGTPNDVNPNPVDLVYNRLTDFYLEGEESSTLRLAFEERAIALTPAPRHYALFADKRNLELLSDPEALRDFGLSPEHRELLLRHVPRSFHVDGNDGEDLWSQRKQFFFKPATGHASRGTYDGAKLTRKVFQRILTGGYVAQAKIPPSTRSIRIAPDDTEQDTSAGLCDLIDMKVDLRAVVYEGQIQQVSARLYRGQTTNMRTVGGGLASVFTTTD